MGSGKSLRPQDLATLLELFRLRSGYLSTSLSSAELGLRLGVTQQAASNRLLELERLGLIQRTHVGRRFKVTVTVKGVEVARSFYGDLKSAFEDAGKELRFVGTLFTGLGEGAYYVSRPGYQRQFLKALGFRPFPGTLNLKLATPAQQEQRRKLQFLDGVEVQGFRDGSRTFGPVKCFRAKIEASHPAAVLAIERTHYDDSVLEVISPVDLRTLLQIADGDECRVNVLLALDGARSRR